MAYATVAGLPVSVGLYTAFVPMVVYALLGTSRVLSVSSTTTLAILIAAELGARRPGRRSRPADHRHRDAHRADGGLLVVASLLRLGFVANFISLPVLTGFKAGIGLVIVLDQVPKLFGIHITKEGFFRDISSLVQHLPESLLHHSDHRVVTLCSCCWRWSGSGRIRRRRSWWSAPVLPCRGCSASAAPASPRWATFPRRCRR